MFNCLMNTGGKHIPKDLRNELVKAACDMARHQKKLMRVETDECAGVVRTSWKRSSMGTIVGVEFVAEVVVAGAESTITYLMRDFDLESMPDGWVGFESIEELDRAAN